MFIGRTILRRVSTGDVVEQWPTFVRTPAGALARLTAEQRQTVQADPGDYTLDYQIRCHYVTRVRGEDTATGNLVLEYDVWRTKAAADAGDPPDWTNTHTFAGRPKAWAGWTGAERRQWLRWHIEAAIRDAAHRDATGNETDRRARVRAVREAGIGALDGAAVEHP